CKCSSTSTRIATAKAVPVSASMASGRTYSQCCCRPNRTRAENPVDRSPLSPRDADGTGVHRYKACRAETRPDLAGPPPSNTARRSPALAVAAKYGMVQCTSASVAAANGNRPAEFDHYADRLGTACCGQLRQQSKLDLAQRAGKACAPGFDAPGRVGIAAGAGGDESVLVSDVLRYACP